MPRSRSEITAEGFRELAAELDEHRVLLDQIKTLLVDMADGQSEMRDRLRDAVDRHGTRLLNVERRVGALELVSGGNRDRE